MKQQISTRLLSVLPVVLVAASLLAVAPLLFESAPASAALQPSGTITITVKEGFSEAPLEGATVVIPEIQQSFLTDEKGQTPAIAVPIRPASITAASTGPSSRTTDMLIKAPEEEPKPSLPRVG